MDNILIITDDLKYSKSLLNRINKDIKNVSVCFIASNDKEITYSLLNYNIDLILMDSSYEHYKKLVVNKIIAKRKLKNSIILISDCDVDETYIKASKYLYDYVIKSMDLSNVIQKTKMLVYARKSTKRYENDKFQELKLKEKIKNELLYLGYKSSHKGTKYMIDAIFILLTLNDYYDNNLEKDIYPIIGKKYGRPVNGIRGCIGFATEAMTYECEEERLKEYLHMKEYEKPGGKKIIEAVLGKIK